jgi:hypothetical protein
MEVWSNMFPTSNRYGVLQISVKRIPLMERSSLKQHVEMKAVLKQ